MLQPKQQSPVVTAATEVDSDQQQQPADQQPPESCMTSFKSAVFPDMARKRVTLFAVILILAGLSSIGCNVTDLVLTRMGNNAWDVNDVGVVCHGIWAGFVCVGVGALAVAAGKKKTKCLVVSCEILCFLTTLIALAQLALGIFGTVVGPKCYFRFYHTDFVGRYYDIATTTTTYNPFAHSSYNRYYYFSGDGYQTFYDVPCYFKYNLIIFIMHVAMAGLGLAEALAAIAIWILCCRAHGCCTFWRGCFRSCCASCNRIRQILEGTYENNQQNRNVTEPLVSTPSQMTSQLPALAGNQQFVFIPVLLPANYQPLPGQVPVQGLSQFGNGIELQPFVQSASTQVMVNHLSNTAAGQPSSRPLTETVEADHRDTVLLLNNDGNDINN